MSHNSSVPDTDIPASLLVAIYTRLRSIAGCTFVVPFTIFMSFFVTSAGFAGNARLATKFMRFWSLSCLRLFGIHLVTTGTENLPAAGGGIVLFNHQSHFDILSLMASTRKNIRFGAKIELFKIPFFGASMRAVGTLPIARENRSEVFRIYREAQKRFDENTIFVLAPEGTRQKQPVIGRFKRGPFAFAINAQVPLIPVVIKGAYEVLPKGSLGVNLGQIRRTIHVRYLPAVVTKDLGTDQVDRLLQQIRDEMVAAFDGLEASAGMS